MGSSACRTVGKVSVLSALELPSAIVGFHPLDSRSISSGTRSPPRSASTSSCDLISVSRKNGVYESTDSISGMH